MYYHVRKKNRSALAQAQAGIVDGHPARLTVSMLIPSCKLVMILLMFFCR